MIRYPRNNAMIFRALRQKKPRYYVMTSKTESRRAKIWTNAAVVVNLERVFIDAQATLTKQSKITYCSKK